MTVLRPAAAGFVTGMAYDSPSLLGIGWISDLVAERTSVPSLTQPAGTDAKDVAFTVKSGDTAATIATRLADAGLLTDPRAFVYLALEKDLSTQFQAGDFTLRQHDDAGADRVRPHGSGTHDPDGDRLGAHGAAARADRGAPRVAAGRDRRHAAVDRGEGLPRRDPQAAGSPAEGLPVAGVPEGRDARGLPRGRRLPASARRDGRGPRARDARPLLRGGRRGPDGRSEGARAVLPRGPDDRVDRRDRGEVSRRRRRRSRASSRTASRRRRRRRRASSART